jgi:hypothetical protein
VGRSRTVFWLEEVPNITMEHEGTESIPDGCMVPVFTENVSRVTFTRDMVVTGDACSDGLTSTVVGEGIVALVELGVWNGGSVDN